MATYRQEEVGQQFRAFADVVMCWVVWAYEMSFGDKLLPFWGRCGTGAGPEILDKAVGVARIDTVLRERSGGDGDGGAVPSDGVESNNALGSDF
ncbi:hypothetical protein U1Q18_000437 [Sarracenia purpurea var. burkii]